MRKNIKKVAKIGVTGLLAAGLLVGSVEYASHMFVLTNKVVAKQVDKVKEDVKTSSKSGLDSEDVSKQETVYATLDANGKKTDVIVSDWLKNAANKGEVKDSSDLKDITNTKGDEKFTQDGDTVNWNTESDDIYYQGKTDKEMPVGMSITYKLDGKEIAAKDLAGKSGKLEMKIKYTNTSKKTEKIGEKDVDIYTPFVMVTGMILPVDNFKNLTIDNGSVVSEGENNIVMAYGMPGLSESLDLDNLDLGDDVDIDLSKINDKVTDTVTIKADVTDFEMKSTYTVATSEFFSDMDLDDIGNMDDLSDKLDDLTDATQKLIDGSDKLSTNLDTLNDKFGDYSDGMDTLKSGVSSANIGSNTLKNGIVTYTKGTDKLLDGVITYVAGTKTFSKSVKTYSSNTKKIVDAVGTLQKTGTSKLSEGSKTFDTNLNTYVTTVNTSLNSVDTLAQGIDTLHSGVVSLQNGVTGEEGLKAGVKKIKAGVSALQTGVTGDNGLKAGVKRAKDSISGDSDSTLKKAVTGVKGGVSSVKSGVKAINDGAKNIAVSDDTVNTMLAELETLKATASDADKAKIEAIEKYVKASQTVGKTIEDSTSDSSALVKGLDTMDSTLDKTSAGLDSLSAGMDSLSTGLDTVSAGLTSVDTGLNGVDGGLDKVNAGLTQMESSTNTKSEDSELNGISDKLTQLKDAGSALSTAYSKQLNPSVEKLDESVKKMYKAGTKLTSNNKKLDKAADKLIKNEKTITKNSKKVTSSSNKLRTGAKSLASGAVKLFDGVSTLVSKTGDVSDAIGKLADGAGDLKDGVVEFNEDGIEKLTGTVNEVIDSGDDFRDRLDKIVKASNNYKSFSKISDGMEGSVKFVMSTASIEKDDDK